MKKLIYIFLLLGLFSHELIAKPITQTEAMAIAREFFNKGRSQATPLQFQTMPYQIRRSIGTVANDPFYIFNAEREKGFVIISGDDEFTNILGYADEGSFELDNAPSSLIEWMKIYSQYITAYQQKGNILPMKKLNSTGNVVVQPLLKEISWGQDYPFNQQCPTYTSGLTTTHYYTGCVVTAVTQIMKYYNYPEKGIGSKSYLFNKTTLTANFGETTYDWNNMPPTYPETTIPQVQIDAAAKLAAHFGIAVEMDYAPEGSGAYTMLVPTALKEYFGYDKRTNMRRRDYYSTSEWMELIKAELNAQRPVYYGASSDSGEDGHAFVCDGYDSNEYVHINWGWSGQSDGYFMMNHLDPDDLGEGGGSGGYNTNQEIVIGIQPPTSSDEDICLPLYGSSRLSCDEYYDGITLMSFIENLDTHPFSGSIGAVITRNGAIVKVLKEESLTIAGSSAGISGTKMLTMRDIPTEVSGMENGRYEIRLGYKSTVAKTWQTIRHYTGYPGYVDLTITDGKAIIEGIHTPKPDVTLLEKITTDGAIYAKGSGMFHLKLRNNSKEMRLEEINIQFQSTTNPAIKGQTGSAVHIYEESTETLNLLLNLDETLPAGEYEVIAYEEGYPDYPFNDQGVGRTIMTILPESKNPIIRLVQPIEWRNDNGSLEIQQGDNLYLALAARNYGSSGTIGIITYVQDVNNADRQFVFQQNNVTVKKGELITPAFFRQLPVDPGTYRIYARYLTADNQQLAVDAPVKECIITVKENSNIILNVESMNIPDELTSKAKVAGDITFQAPKDFSGTVYLRLRPLTLTAGEIIYMKSNTSIKAGESLKLSFNYTPDLVPGIYIVLVEAKIGSTYGSIGNYDNCYKIINVNAPSGVNELVNEKIVEAYPSVVTDCIYLKKSNDCLIDRAELIDMQGSLVQIQTSINDKIEVNTLSTGVYILRLSTNKGIVLQKIIKK